MSLDLSSLVGSLRDIVEALRRDYIETSSDLLIRARSKAFSDFYRVKPLVSADLSSSKPFVFVDAGFKIYQLDVAAIIPMQISALYRDEGGSLMSVDRLIGGPAADAAILYVSRKRSGDGYVFSARIKCPSDSLLFETRGKCEEIGVELNRLISETISYKRVKAPKFFVRLASYFEGLMEIAYGLRLRRALREELGLDPTIVYDGTLVRWFSIRRGFGSKIDGLDIVSEIVGERPESLSSELLRVLGLSKTTKFTTLARSYGLFSSYASSRASGRGYYTEVNVEGLHELSRELTSLDRAFAARDFVEETVRIFNRVVYDVHGVYAIRFPVTSDYENVFMVDLYATREVIGIRGSSVVVDVDEARRVNDRLSSTVPSLYAYRSKLRGEPPYGFMEVDSVVRYSRDLSSSFESLLVGVMDSLGEPSMRPLVQAFSSTFQMRYGYK